MHTFLYSYRIILVAICLFSTSLATAKVEKQHFALNTGDFAELRVVDGLNVVYHASADSAGMVVFDATRDVAPMILVSNDKNTLKIQLQTEAVGRASLPEIHVYSSFLSGAENSGDSTLTVISPTPGARLKMRVVGNGRIIARGLHATVVEGSIDTGKGSLYLSGNTNWAKLRTVGTGSIQAGDLKGHKGSIFIGGTGSVDCYITSELTVTGLGSGKIYVKGNPKVKNRTLGTVKVINVE